MLRALTFLCFLSTAPMACASLPTWVGVEIQSFAQTKSNPEIVYATGGGVLFKSIDRGKSWGPIKTPKNSGYVLAVPERHDHLVIWSRYSAKLEGQLFPLGYMESKDGGRTWAWNAIPVDVKRIAQNDQLSDFLIDQIEYGGAWWVVIGGLLLRSIDEGANWEINTEKVQSRIHILHTPILSYRLSGNTLYRSRDRGAIWNPLHVFPVENKVKSDSTDLLNLSDGQLLIRVNNAWYRVGDNGDDLIIEEVAMKGLPDTILKTPASATDRYSNISNWHCRMKQAKDNPVFLFAFCVYDNGSWPSQLCLYRSEDGGKTWAKPEDGQSGCHADLPRWRPISLWMDQAEPSMLIISWMAGGVYRSEDRGISWKRSDQGLRFNKPDNEFRFEAIFEPKLIQAVIERDKSAVDKILAGGVDINAPGNYVGGVLEADLLVASRSRSQNTNEMLYGYLRARGAKPPLKRADGSEGLLTLSCRLGLHEVIKDLIDFGYDWASLSNDLSDSQPPTELAECLRSATTNAHTIAGLPIATWIDRYVKARKFPSADQVVVELFNAEHRDLGMKVLKAASRDSAFDLQKTSISPKRIAIISKLFDMKEYIWAKKVFLSYPVNKILKFKSDEERQFAATIGYTCKPEIVRWYEKRGVPVSYSLSCLFDSDYSKNFRIKMLALMDSRGDIHHDHWAELLNTPETKWLEATPQYRRHIERSSGIVGIVYENDKSGGLSILKVYDDFPAKEVGLQAGDLITAVNGTTLTSTNAGRLSGQIRGFPGTKVSLNLRRDSKEWVVTLVRKRLP